MSLEEVKDGLVDGRGCRRGSRAEGPPDPKLRVLTKRRQFNAAYELEVLEEADRCTRPGAIVALLRGEGLYGSHGNDY